MPAPLFQLWSAKYIEGYCVVTPPEGVPDSFELSRGVNRQANWSADSACRMSNEYPKDIELPDNLFGAGLVIVSHRLHDFLHQAGVDDVEYLRVRVLNHKGKIAAEDFVIVNPPRVVECIDIAASGVTWNRIKKDLISRCERLVIDAAKVAPQLQVFRPKHLPTKILVRAELAGRLAGAGFTGLNFRDPAEFTGS